MPMRVHMHSVLPFRGGAARVARLIEHYLYQEGVGVTFSYEVEDGGERVGRIPSEGCDSHFRSSYQDMQLMPAEVGGVFSAPLGESLSQDSFSLLHLHSSQNWSECLTALVKRAGTSGVGSSHIPLVITLHDSSLLTGGCVHPLGCKGIHEGCFSECPRGFSDAQIVQAVQWEALLRLRPLLVTPSSWLKRYVKHVLPELNCRVVPNGVESPEAYVASRSRFEARAALGLHKDAKVALFMAHGGERAVYKCGPEWGELWSQVSSRVPQGLAFMVGGETHSQDGNVIRWPYVDREKVLLLMRAADCFVYPTLADNHPLVVLEAMSVGLPVLSYRVGGVVEQVRDGETGVLVESGDSAALVNACVNLLTQPHTQRDMRTMAEEAFVRRFTASRMGADYMKAYRSLM